MKRRRTVATILGAAVLSAAPVLLVTAGGIPARAQVPTPKPSPSNAGSKKSTPAKATPSKKRKSTRRTRARAQRAPNAERITEIQQALAREGHYTGAPTGKWDASSVTALKSFQEANGLNPTGKLDARSLQKLGLGSEVAGAAPPRAAPANGDAPPARP